MLSSHHQRKRKREICLLCNRPKPETCICSALPDEPLTLSKSRVIVLQHPHEQRRKNRSLPLVELCFSKNSSNYLDQQGCHEVAAATTIQQMNLVENDVLDTRNDKSLKNLPSTTVQNFDFHCIIARRLGDQVNKELMKNINDVNQVFLLVYPTDDAISLNEALKRINQEESDKKPNNSGIGSKKIILFFIDATWKYAEEMLKSGMKENVWPPHAIHVKLTKNDLAAGFQPRRFDIRTPPSLEHLSTAECIAHTLRLVEGSDAIFDVLMKPLDLMVQQWHSFFREQKMSS